MLYYLLFWAILGFIIHFYIIFGTNLLTGGPAQNCCFSCRADDPAGLKISRTCLFSLFYEFLSFFPVPKMYGSVQNSYLTNCGFSDMKKSASHQVGCDADFSLWLNLHKCRNSFAIRSSPIFSHGCGGLTQDPFYPGMSSTAPMPGLWRPPLLR